MNAVVLLTAMTATSGLFGGHRQARTASCQGGSCARPAVVAYAPATCQTGRCPQPYSYAAPARAVYAPAPAMAYTSYYSPPAQAATCTTGTCPKR